MNGKFVAEIPQGSAVCLMEDGRLSVFRFCLLAVPLKQGIWTRFQQVGATGENQNVVKLAGAGLGLEMQGDPLRAPFQPLSAWEIGHVGLKSCLFLSSDV